MTIKLSGVRSVGNGGDGIRVEGNVDLQGDDIYVANNGGQGINIIKHASIMEQFGLPSDTAPTELANLLQALRDNPSTASEAIVKESSLWGKFSGGVLNTSTFVSNLVNIANSPQGLTLISHLLT